MGSSARSSLRATCHGYLEILASMESTPRHHRPKCQRHQNHERLVGLSHIRIIQMRRATRKKTLLVDVEHAIWPTFRRCCAYLWSSFQHLARDVFCSSRSSVFPMFLS